MNIKLASKIDERVETASKILGIEKKEVLDRALIFYLDNVENALAMKNEFEVWEMLSDEAWSKVRD